MPPLPPAPPPPPPRATGATGAAAPALARLLLQTADAVAAVRAGRSLTEALTRGPGDLRAGTQALSFHVLRAWGSALAVRELLAPKAPPPAVDALLLSALALLWPAGDPPYAEHTLVDQAVAAARQRTPGAASFVNAVLRRFLREREALVAAVQRQPQAAYNHPAWWIERVRNDWPAHWAELLAAANRHPPMALRVNARRASAAQYVQRLAAAGRAAQAIGAQGVVLERPCAVTDLPGFAEGDVSVQDLSAQRAAPLLLGLDEGLGTSGASGTHPLPLLRRGARVLDACAAPGGKTAHLLELADLNLLALDSDAQRLARVQGALNRLNLRATLKAGDARHAQGWWDGQPFDAILLDAPCSASGIVRRHPDVRWLRRPDDLVHLSRTQAEMLDALWPLLRPGGRLLYATCSIFRAEGQQQIDAFLQRQRAACPMLWPHSPGHLSGLPDNGRPRSTQGAPAAPTGDGFFYALLIKP